MSRIKRGWQLTGKSWRVLRSHPALFRFPLYGALVALLPIVVLILPGIYLIDIHEYAPGVALLAVGLFLSSFAVLYFAVGLVAAADKIFQGQEATTADGLAVARTRLRPIAGWALVSTVVGLILAALESQEAIAAIIGRLLGAAWSLITFLAVPVIAIEGTGPIETFKRSTSLFRSRWAGQITGNVTIGAAVFVFGMLPAIAITVLGVILWISDGAGTEVAAGAVLVALGVALFLLSALVQRALQGIFGLALYRFVGDDQATGGFTADELGSAVAVKS